jgi:hypothetical protein
VPGPENILYPEFALPLKRRWVVRVEPHIHHIAGGACKGKEVASMRRLMKVLVLSALLVVIMATTNVSVASACPWWANKCTDTAAYGREECQKKDKTGGSTTDKSCGWKTGQA